MICSRRGPRWSREVPTTSLGPAFHPESMFDDLRAQNRPPEAEKGQKLDALIFSERRISVDEDYDAVRFRSVLCAWRWSAGLAGAGTAAGGRAWRVLECRRGWQYEFVNLFGVKSVLVMLVVAALVVLGNDRAVLFPFSFCSFFPRFRRLFFVPGSVAVFFSLPVPAPIPKPFLFSVSASRGFCRSNFHSPNSVCI